MKVKNCNIIQYKSYVNEDLQTKRYVSIQGHIDFRFPQIFNAFLA